MDATSRHDHCYRLGRKATIQTHKFQYKSPADKWTFIIVLTSHIYCNEYE